MDLKIIGKWKVESGSYTSLTYHFNSDGSFEMEMPALGLKGCGKYTTNEKTNPHQIDINFLEHSAGIPATGIYRGIYEFEGENLKMKLGTANGDRWKDKTGYITYKKIE